MNEINQSIVKNDKEIQSNNRYMKTLLVILTVVVFIGSICLYFQNQYLRERYVEVTKDNITLNNSLDFSLDTLIEVINDKDKKIEELKNQQQCNLI